MRFTLAVFVATAFICGIAYAGPREESLSYNSRCIRAHADRYDYIPSTSQNATLDAASGNPKKVLSLLIGVNRLAKLTHHRRPKLTHPSECF